MTLSSVGKVDVKKLNMKIRLQNPNSTGEGVQKSISTKEAVNTSSVAELSMVFTNCSISEAIIDKSKFDQFAHLIIEASGIGEDIDDFIDENQVEET